MDYNTKLSGFESNYLTTFDYKNFISKALETKIKEKSLVNKSNICNLLRNSYL